MTTSIDIKSLSKHELLDVLAQWGEKSFRVGQIWEWLYQKDATTFDEMTNLSKALRARLAQDYSLYTPTVLTRQISQDNTRKYLLGLEDGCHVETVGIPSGDGKRLTVCISSQVGCGMGCVFCATGHGGFKRNLSQSEIISQVQVVSCDFGMRVSNVVVMGQGEPFINYDATLGALSVMNDSKGLNIGARHITISTCGVIPGILRLAKEPKQYTMALSLHSALQKSRDSLMPGVSSMNLVKLKDALREYISLTNRRPTFEYAMIKGVNDTDEHLEALIDFCSDLLCHVNLIPLNPIKPNNENCDWIMEPSKRTEHFFFMLNKAGIEASIRQSRGADIDGACGQLSQRVTKDL